MNEDAPQPIAEQSGGIRETRRKPLEISPEESEVMDAFVDLQPKIHDINLTKSERIEVIDMLQKLIIQCGEKAKEGEGFWVEMHARIEAMSDEFYAIANAVDAFHAAEKMKPEDRGFIEVVDVAYDLLKVARGRRLSEHDFAQMAGDLYRMKQQYMQLKVRGA
jgi:hypothetical protein